MKRLIAIALLLACVLAFAACSNDDEASIFSFKYKNVNIELGKNAEKVLEKLGEPLEKEDNGNCGGRGTQWEYKYLDFELYTLEQDGKETIDEIEFETDMVQTSKGISIGMKKEAVIEAYGEPTQQKENKITYTSEKLSLIFGISDNGNVKSIEYKRAA